MRHPLLLLVEAGADKVDIAAFVAGRARPCLPSKRKIATATALMVEGYSAGEAAAMVGLASDPDSGLGARGRPLARYKRKDGLADATVREIERRWHRGEQLSVLAAEARVSLDHLRARMDALENNTRCRSKHDSKKEDLTEEKGHDATSG